MVVIRSVVWACAFAMADKPITQKETTDRKKFFE